LKEQGKDDELLIGLLFFANIFFKDLQESDELLKDLTKGQTWDNKYVDGIRRDEVKLQEFINAAEKMADIYVERGYGKKAVTLAKKIGVAEDYFKQFKTPPYQH